MPPDPATSWKRRFGIWPIHAVIVLLFTAMFTLHEQGTSGKLSSEFTYEKLFPALRRVSAFFTDIKFKLRGKAEVKNPIVIVEIDSPSIETLGRWPWRRDYLAYLIDQIFAMGARVVGLDMLFSEPEKRVPDELKEMLQDERLLEMIARFETDPKLARTVKRHADRIVLAWTSESPCQPLLVGSRRCPVNLPEAIASLPPQFEKFAIEGAFFATPLAPELTPIPSAVTLISNFEPFNEAARHQGFVNSSRDPDGLIRRAGLVMMVNGRPHPSLPLEMASLALKEDIRIELDGQHRIKKIAFTNSDRTIPVTPSGIVGINFRGPERSFPYLSAREVFVKAESSRNPRELASALPQLKDAIVLIGISAAALADITATPFDATMPGVEAHATILDNLLSGESVISGPSEKRPGLAFALVLLLMVAGAPALAVGMSRLEALPAICFFVVAFATLFFIDLRAFFNFHRDWNTGFFYLELIVIAVVLIGEKYVTEERNKKAAEARLLEEQLTKYRMETELKTAQLVQSTLLAPPQIEAPEVELAWCYVPATECCGDLWDATLHGNQLRVLIGDATGHGAPAAIVTAVAKSCYSTLLTLRNEKDLTPSECLALLNRIVFSACRGKLLMTMCMLQLDLETGEIQVSNAGHESPFWLKASGEPPLDKLFVRGERLGFSVDSVYENRHYQLQRNDTLLLYSDGISEAEALDGQAWGVRRLRRALVEQQGRPVEAIRDGIIQRVHEHTQGKPQDDDLTFVLLRWKGFLIPTAT